MANNIKTRPAKKNDFSELANFLSFEYFVHRHLDWRSSLDWLGHQPFLIAENEREIVAIFGVSSGHSISCMDKAFCLQRLC